jgi:hypothetical protein
MHQAGKLRLDGGEIAGLNLYQQIVSHNIDHEPGDRDFKSIPRSRVPLFQ